MNQKSPRAYVQPYIAGTLLGIVLFLAFFITGNGLGASGGLNRIVVAVEDLVVPQHVNKVPYLAKMAGGDINPFDHWTVIMVIGVIMGGFFSGIANRRFKVETRKGPQISVRSRWMFAFLGGVIMVYGARLARGCTSGQALSGGAVLSVGSWAFMLCIFFSAYVVAWFVRKMWN